MSGTETGELRPNEPAPAPARDGAVQPLTLTTSPSSTGNATGSSTPSVVRQVGLGAAGIWLIILVLTSVVIAVVIFSAVQFQSRVAGITISGGPLTIWKADQLRGRWAASLVAWAEIKAAHIANENQLSELSRRRVPLSDDVTRAGFRIYSIRSELADKISRTDTELATKVREARIDDVSALIYPTLAKLIAADDSISSDLDHFVVARNTFREHENNAKAFEAQLTDAHDNVRRSAVALEAATAKINVVVDASDGVPDEHKRTIENTIFEFQSMQAFKLYWPVYVLTLAPTDLLVLILVTVMGVLGSTLQLSHVYTAEFSAKPISFYLFRPFLGVITAFVIFIVAKAGVPLIADPGRLGGTSPVNPYFISFLAIISGLVSERALETLRRLGSSYFRDTSDGPSRWALVNLKDAFKKANRDPTKLREAIDAKPAEFDAWLDGKKPIPPSAQNYIAVALNLHPRTLFSDIPPPDDAQAESQTAKRDDPANHAANGQPAKSEKRTPDPASERK